MKTIAKHTLPILKKKIVYEEDKKIYEIIK
jgi:hypothetical protein